MALTGATATCQTTGLGVGSDQLTAVYSGTSGYQGSGLWRADACCTVRSGVRDAIRSRAG